MAEESALSCLPTASLGEEGRARLELVSNAARAYSDCVGVSGCAASAALSKAAYLLPLLEAVVMPGGYAEVKRVVSGFGREPDCIAGSSSESLDQPGPAAAPTLGAALAPASSPLGLHPSPVSGLYLASGVGRSLTLSRDETLNDGSSGDKLKPFDVEALEPEFFTINHGREIISRAQIWSEFSKSHLCSGQLPATAPSKTELRAALGIKYDKFASVLSKMKRATSGGRADFSNLGCGDVGALAVAEAMLLHCDTKITGLELQGGWHGFRFRRAAHLACTRLV